MMCNNIKKQQKLKTAAKNTVNAGNKWIKNITKGNAAFIKKVIHRDDVHMCSMYWKKNIPSSAGVRCLDSISTSRRHQGEQAVV